MKIVLKDITSGPILPHISEEIKKRNVIRRFDFNGFIKEELVSWEDWERHRGGEQLVSFIFYGPFINRFPNERLPLYKVDFSKDDISLDGKNNIVITYRYYRMEQVSEPLYNTDRAS